MANSCPSLTGIFTHVPERFAGLIGTVEALDEDSLQALLADGADRRGRQELGGVVARVRRTIAIWLTLLGQPLSGQSDRVDYRYCSHSPWPPQYKGCAGITSS
jgi:hypothetical protein